VVGLELAIEQGEAADLQPRDQPRQRDLGGIGGAAHHALAEEGATERQAIEPADQPIAVPAFDRMRMAHRVEAAESRFDRMVDPRFRPVRRARRA